MKQKQLYSLCEEVDEENEIKIEYCALCSAMIRNNKTNKDNKTNEEIEIKIDEYTKYFCSKKCYDKFKEFIKIRKKLFEVTKMGCCCNDSKNEEKEQKEQKDCCKEKGNEKGKSDIDTNKSEKEDSCCNS